MSFSQEIKNYLIEKSKKSSICCNAAFHSAVNSLPPNLLSDCCISAYFSGLFYAFGTVTDPKKRFHLSITPPAEIAENAFSFFPEHIRPLRTTRKGKTVFYYAGSAGIEDFLTFIGAGKFSLEVMQNTVTKSLRVDTNRLSNAEYANIARSASASADAIKAIAVLRKAGAFDELTPELKETAHIRELHPDLPLKDLCDCFSPPISKSGLSHRLKRITEAAKKYSE